MTPQQNDMFDPAPPYQRTSDTSRAAAESLSNTAVSRERVFKAIRACGQRGATDQELQTMLRLVVNAEIPRRWELVNQGRVRDSGCRRKNRSGRNAVVWIATDEQTVGVTTHENGTDRTTHRTRLDD